jgi:hypothetical protein
MISQRTYSRVQIITCSIKKVKLIKILRKLLKGGVRQLVNQVLRKLLKGGVHPIS